MRFDKCILFWLCHLILLICIDFCFRFSRINIQRIVSYFIAGVTFTELLVKTKRHNCKYAVITFIIISALGDSGFFKTSRYQGIVKATVSWVLEDLKFKRAIFQTFWKPDCCTKSLFLDLETLNFGYLLIF